MPFVVILNPHCTRRTEIPPASSARSGYRGAVEFAVALTVVHHADAQVIVKLAPTQVDPTNRPPGLAAFLEGRNLAGDGDRILHPRGEWCATSATFFTMAFSGRDDAR